jgi:hypothetical protein
MLPGAHIAGGAGDLQYSEGRCGAAKRQQDHIGLPEYVHYEITNPLDHTASCAFRESVLLLYHKKFSL